MGKTIDERVVQMKFENGQFESNVKQSMSTIEKLKNALKFNDQSKGLENVAAATKKVDMNQLASSVDKVKVSFSALQVVAATALSQITSSAINAGKSIVNALTLDPVISGFQEYETKMNAVQTIMANVSSKGKTIEDVNKVLDDLNHYADKTIYNFTEMTRNIGTFTAAGVDLETAASAIQGIANLAATAGSNAQQTATGMYQLSQALAAGSVKLQDWNSVVTAGMGGEIFQEGLKETAREMGIAVDSIIEKNGTFRESLKDGWVSADVLNTTLKKFTVEGATEYAKSMEASGKYTAEMSKKLIEQAQMMEDASTKIKTFTQLWDTMKESAQSGWTESWEIIIGNFEQAKETLSKLGDMLTGFVQSAADKRNAFLKGALGDSGDAWSSMGEKLKEAGIEVEEFQNRLIEVGKKHGVVTDQMIKDAGSFTNSLKTGWASADIIKETLQSYIDGGSQVAQSTEEMTSKLEMFQKVVDEVWRGKWSTAPERYQLLADAGYDYAKVQELVNKTVDGHRLTLADLSETQAKAIGFTDEQIKVLKDLSAQADTTGTDLNNLIEQMARPKSGRELLWESVFNIIEAVRKAVTALRTAWEDVFPPMTSKTLYNLIKGFNEFTKKLILSNDQCENLYKTFKGLFSILKLVTTIVSGALKGAFTVLKTLFSNANIDILKYTGYVGDLISKFVELVTSTNGLTIVLDTLRNAFTFLIDHAQKLWQWFSNLQVVQNLVARATEFVNEKVEILKMLFGDTWKLLEDFIDRVKNMDFSNGFHLNDLLNIIRDFKENVLGEVADIDKIVIDIKTNIRKAPSNIVNAANGIGTGLSKVYGVLKQFADKLQLNIRPNIDLGEILAVGLGGASIYYITQFGKLLEKLKGPLESVDKLISAAAGVPTAISGYINAMTKNAKYDGVYTLAKSIGVLAASLVAIAAIPTDKLWSSVAVIGILATTLGILGKAMGGVTAAGGVAGLGAMAAAFISMGVAMGILSKSLKSIGDLAGSGNLGAAVSSLELLMVTFAAITKYLGKGFGAGAGVTKLGIASSVSSMIAFAVAIKLLASSLSDIGSLDTAGMIKGLIGLISIMGMLKLVMASMRGTTFGTGAGAIAAVIAVKMLMGTLQDLAAMDYRSVLAALPSFITIMGMMAVLMLSTNLAGKNALKGGFGVAAMASSLILVAQAVKTMSEIKPTALDNATKSVAAIMGMMTLMTMATGLSGKYAVRAGIAIIAMATGLTMLSGAIAVLSQLDADGVKRATAALSVLSAFFIGLVAVSKFATGTKATIIALVTAVTILAAAMAALAMIDGQSLITSAACLVSVMGLLAVLFKTINGMKVNVSGVVAMALVMAEIAALVYMIRSMNPQSALPNALAISALMASLAAMMTATKVMKPMTKGAFATMQSCILVLTEVSAIVAALSALGIEGLSDQALKSIAVVTAIFTALAGAMSVMGYLVDKFNVTAKMAAKASGITALVTTIAGIFVGLVGIVNDILGKVGFDLVAKLESGGAVLEKLGAAIGNFIGGIAGGVGKGWSTELPEVGKNLSEFAQNAKGFFDIADKIENVDMTNITAMIQAISSLYKNDILKEFAKSMGAGDATFATLGQDMTALGDALNELVEKTKDLTPEQIAPLANIMTALADLNESINSKGGWKSIVMGFDDLGTYSSQLVTFATNFNTFISSLDQISIDDGTVRKVGTITTIAQSFSTLQQALEPILGSVQFFTGHKMLSTFGADMSLFISSFSKVNDALNEMSISEANVGKAQRISELAGPLVELSKSVQPMLGTLQFFTGHKMLSSFGMDLALFMRGFGTALEGIKGITIDEGAEANVEKIVGVAKKFSELQKDLEPIGGFIDAFTGFTDLASFGANLSSFMTAMKDALSVFGAVQITGMSSVTNIIDTAMVDSIVKVTGQFVTLAKKVPEAKTELDKLFTGDNTLEGFAKDIKKFAEQFNPAMEELGALSSADGSAKNSGKYLNSGYIDNIVQAVTKLTTLQSIIEPMDTWFQKMDQGTSTDPADFAKKMKTFAENIMPALQSFGAIQYSGMSGVGMQIDQGLIDNIINTVKKLAQLQTALNQENQISEEEGYKQVNLSTFANRIADLGTAMGTFNTAIGTDFNADGIDRAIQAMGKIAELQNAVSPMEGVINRQKTGTTDLTSFASRIESLGKAMGSFNTALGENFNAEAIDQAIAAMGKISALQSGLTEMGGDGSSGTTNLGVFASNISQLGSHLKAMMVQLGDVDWSIVDNTVANLRKLSDLSTEFANSDFSGFETFKQKLVDLAKDSISGFTDTFQNAHSEVTTAVANFIRSISNAFANNTSIVENAAEGLVRNIPTKISSYEGDVKAAGETLSNAVKSGLESQKNAIPTTFGTTLNACVSKIRGFRTQFETAGKYIAAGLAAGIRAGVAEVKAAATALAAAAETAANIKLDIGSPSKVFNRIGRFVVAGLVQGIRKDTPLAEEQSMKTAQNIVTAFQKELQINSPSKVTRDKVGRYIVDGITEGIEKNTTAEEAAQKKAQNIVNAFKEEIDKFELDETTWDLEDKLWEAMNTQATEAQKTARENALLEKKLQTQASKVLLAQGEYETIVANLGKTSEEAQESYNKYLQEMTELYELANQLVENQTNTQKTAIDANLEAYNKVNEFMNSDAIETLKKLGYTEDQLWKYADEKFGYDRNLGFGKGQNQQKILKTGQEYVNEALANAKGTYAEFEGTAKAAGTAAGTAYTTANATAIQNGSKTTTQAAQKNMTATTTATATVTTAQAKQAGIEYGDAMAAGIESRKARIAEVIKSALKLSSEDLKSVAEDVIHEFVAAIGTVVDKTDELTDYEPVIRPVVDMSDVEKKAQIINSTFNGGGSYNVASKTQHAVSSSKSNTTQSNSMKGSSAGAIYSITQNNYSPKALDRGAIYRQSKNLFSSIANKNGPQIISTVGVVASKA